MVPLLSLLPYLLYALWVDRSSLAVAGKQSSSVTNVWLIFLFIVFIELSVSRYGKFPEFFRHSIFPEKLQPYSLLTLNEHKVYSKWEKYQRKSQEQDFYRLSALSVSKQQCQSSEAACSYVYFYFNYMYFLLHQKSLTCH